MIDLQEILYEVTYKCPVLHTEHTVEVFAADEKSAEEKVRRPFYTILKVKKKDAEQRQN